MTPANRHKQETNPMTLEEAQARIDKLVAALEAARDHLDWIGWGDSWERECAQEARLEERIEEALEGR
jgi:hypothetical protein